MWTRAASAVDTRALVPTYPHPRGQGPASATAPTTAMGTHEASPSWAATMSSTVHSPYYLYQPHILFPPRRSTRSPPERIHTGEVQIRARCARRDARHGGTCRGGSRWLLTGAPRSLVALRGQQPAGDRNRSRSHHSGDRRGHRDRRRELCHSGPALDRHRAPARAGSGDVRRPGRPHHDFGCALDLQAADLSGGGVPARRADE